MLKALRQKSLIKLFVLSLMAVFSMFALSACGGEKVSEEQAKQVAVKLQTALWSNDSETFFSHIYVPEGTSKAQVDIAKKNLAKMVEIAANKAQELQGLDSVTATKVEMNAKEPEKNPILVTLVSKFKDGTESTATMTLRFNKGKYYFSVGS